MNTPRAIAAMSTRYQQQGIAGGLVRAVAIGGIATLAVVFAYRRLFPDLRRMDRFRR